MLLAPTSNLEFPSWRAPGVDLAHPAAQSLRMSCIPASGGAFINLLNGQPTTPTNGTMTTVIQGAIGPSVLSNMSTVYNSVTNAITETPSGTTFGACFIPTSATGNQILVIDAIASSGAYSLMRLANGVLTSGQDGGASTSSGFPSVVIGKPYFAACSLHSANQNFVMVNLATGQMWSSSATSSRSFASISGNYAIGGDATALTEANAYIAAAMMSRAFLSLPTLLAWAAAPWEFWYPDDDPFIRLVGRSSGALALAGLSPSRFQAASGLSGAQTMTALSASRAQAHGASSQAAAFVARSRAIYAARGATGTGAFLSASGAMKAMIGAHAAASLAAALSGRSSARAQTKAAQSLAARLSASSAAGAKARTSPALVAFLAARTRAAASVRGVFSSSAFLFAASGLSQASVRAEAAIHATVRLVINPALVLKAPTTIRSLAAPATTRLLKAISTIRNLKAP
jgi:hypothetical protein